LEPIIEARDLTKVFISRRMKVTAVDHVSLEIYKGEIFGMIGPNGAGKSTTFAMMSTLIKPTSGSIRVSSFDAEKEATKIRQIIGVVPQQYSLYSDLTARENLELMGNLYDVTKKVMEERINYYLKLVNLETHADRFTGGFSGGMKQRLSVISAVIHDPVILGKTIHQLILQLIRAVILILGATVILGVTMNGSWLLVALVLTIFTFGSVGLGIAISAISEDMTSFQQLSLFFTLPSMFATGVFYPLSSVPDWMRWIAYTMPLTYANDAMRIIMVKGQGLSFIARDIFILIIFGVLYFAIGVHLFRREA